MFVFNLHERGDFITCGELKEDSENRIRAIPENIDRLRQIYDSTDLLEMLCNFDCDLTSNCVDHYAVELKYASILRMLHKYD
jgi:hypothetical protein